MIKTLDRINKLEADLRAVTAGMGDEKDVIELAEYARKYVELKDDGVLEHDGHDWTPAFFGVTYHIYRCTKCGSGKREKDGEVGYRQGPPSLFTKWDEPEPMCSVDGEEQ